MNAVGYITPEARPVYTVEIGRTSMPKLVRNDLRLKISNHTNFEVRLKNPARISGNAC